jgi:16S rRNA (cytosine1402-N4)-methyltransferase
MNVVNVVPVLMSPPPLASDPHRSVLLHETVEALRLRSGDLVVDCTLGAGGHTEAILESGDVRVVGIDRDESALSLARERLARFEGRVTFVHGAFAELPQHLERLGVSRVDALVADLGVSSMQLDRAERGLSFRAEGPIDMRMDPSRGETALELVARLSDDELANVIYELGEERRSRRIARCIKQAYAEGALSTTLDLRRAVVRAVGPARVGGVDPATRTFQALRIAINDELGQLHALLQHAAAVLAPGGRAALVSFHSLEDRAVKQAFRDRAVWSEASKKPVVASEHESLSNPRARSAKLRAATRAGVPSVPWEVLA